MALLSDKLIDSIPTSSIQEHKLANNSVSFRTLAQDTKDYIDNSTASTTTSTTLTVGAGGQYETLKQAISAASKLRVVFSDLEKVTVTIEMQANYVIRENIIVSGLNLGYIKITGVDNKTSADITNFESTKQGVGGSAVAFLFGDDGAVLPQLHQSIEAIGNNSLIHIGVHVRSGSSGFVADGKKLISFERGLVAEHGGQITANFTYIDNTTDNQNKAKDNYTSILARYGGHITARGVIINNVGVALYAAANGSIYAGTSRISGAGFQKNVIYATDCSSIDATAIKCTAYSTAAHVLFCNNSSRIGFRSGIANDNLQNLSTQSAIIHCSGAGSAVDAELAQLWRGNNFQTAISRWGANINLRQATSNGSQSLVGYLSVLGGSSINVWGTSIASSRLILNENSSAVATLGVVSKYGIFFG